MSDSRRRHSSLCTFKTMISLWTPFLLLWTCPPPLCRPVSHSHPESRGINEMLAFEKVDLFYSLFFFWLTATTLLSFHSFFLMTVGIEAKVGRKSRSWQTNTVNVIPWQGQRGELSCSREIMAQFFFFWLCFSLGQSSASVPHLPVYGRDGVH